MHDQHTYPRLITRSPVHCVLIWANTNTDRQLVIIRQQASGTWVTVDDRAGQRNAA